MVVVVGIATIGMWQRRRWARWLGCMLMSLLLPLSLWALSRWLDPSFWHDLRTAYSDAAPRSVVVLQMIVGNLVTSFFPAAWLLYFNQPHVKTAFH